MRIGYLCPNGHLTVGRKEEHLKGSLAPKIECIHCGNVATMFEEHTLSESVPFHFEFFRPAIISSEEEKRYLDKGFLLMRVVEDPIITREFEATKGLIRLTEYLLENVEPKYRLPDIIDTAILFLDRHFEGMKAMKSANDLFNKNVN